MKPADHATAEPAFRPFADAASVVTIGGLSIENGADAIALHGSLDLTRDRAGLERARALRATLDAIVAKLESSHPPDAAPEAREPAAMARNPFA